MWYSLTDQKVLECAMTTMLAHVGAGRTALFALDVYVHWAVMTDDKETAQGCPPGPRITVSGEV